YRDGKSADATVKGNAQSQSQSLPRPRQGVYFSDPDHIWNRLFRLFYVRHARDGRQYGGDELDPYLWWQTKYLLSGSSHDEALKLLDEFLGQHSERAITDPLKRALFQRDLLAVNDWLLFPSDEQVQMSESPPRDDSFIAPAFIVLSSAFVSPPGRREKEKGGENCKVAIPFG